MKKPDKCRVITVLPCCKDEKDYEEDDCANCDNLVWLCYNTEEECNYEFMKQYPMMFDNGVYSMKHYRVSYTAFGNFGGKVIIYINKIDDKERIKELVYDQIKDYTWDWELKLSDVEINKVIEIIT